MRRATAEMTISKRCVNAATSDTIDISIDKTLEQLECRRKQLETYGSNI